MGGASVGRHRKQMFFRSLKRFVGLQKPSCGQQRQPAQHVRVHGLQIPPFVAQPGRHVDQGHHGFRGWFVVNGKTFHDNADKEQRGRYVAHTCTIFQHRVDQMFVCFKMRCWKKLQTFFFQGFVRRSVPAPFYFLVHKGNQFVGVLWTILCAILCAILCVILCVVRGGKGRGGRC